MIDYDLRGVDLLRAAVNTILRDPETWNQRNWHTWDDGCATTHCIAGHCQVLVGRDADSGRCKSEVTELLGISVETADWLFDCDRTIHEIHGFCRAWRNLGKVPDINHLYLEEV